jgi:phage-related tail protein
MTNHIEPGSAEIGTGDNSIRTMNKGKQISPYQMYPEHETFNRWTDYRRADGTVYRLTFECSRWAGTWAEPRFIGKTEVL